MLDEDRNFCTNRLLLSWSPVTLSVVPHLVAVSSGASWISLPCCKRLTCSKQVSLSSRASWVSSHLLCEAHLLETGLSLIRSLMSQSHLLHKVHLLEPGDDSFSGLESLTLIALSCNPNSLSLGSRPQNTMGSISYSRSR